MNSEKESDKEIKFFRERGTIVVDSGEQLVVYIKGPIAVKEIIAVIDEEKDKSLKERRAKELGIGYSCGWNTEPIQLLN